MMIAKKIFVSAMGLSCVGASVFAAPQIKTIEVGPGTQNPVSVARFFVVPSRVGAQVLVQLKRTGASGAAFDVPVDIEIRQPGVGNEEDGPIAASKNGVMIGTSNVNLTFNVIGNDNGCKGSPWKVRVRYLNDGNANNNFAVTGTAAFSAHDEEDSVNIEGGLITLNKGISVTKKVGGSSGFGQGNIKVTGQWNHSFGGVPGPLPVKLRFELIKPNGEIADSETAYRTNEPLADPDLFFTYHVLSSANGQWKLRITNNSDHDVMNIDPKIIFNPRCFD